MLFARAYRLTSRQDGQHLCRASCISHGVRVQNPDRYFSEIFQDVLQFTKLMFWCLPLHYVREIFYDQVRLSFHMLAGLLSHAVSCICAKPPWLGDWRYGNGQMVLPNPAIRMGWNRNVDGIKTSEAILMLCCVISFELFAFCFR